MDAAGLTNLDNLSPVYFLPEDPFATEVLIPCFSKADYVRCMMGFFTSASLRTIAPGLATCVQRDTKAISLLISPYLTEEDKLAMELGVFTTAEALERKFSCLIEDSTITEQAILRHTRACLAYLISLNRIEIRLAVSAQGLFHPKAWLFSEGEDLLVAHGSVNMTNQGLTENIENITIACSWVTDNELKVTDRFSSQFNKYWQGNDINIETVPLPEAIKRRLVITYTPDRAPTPQDFFAAWHQDYANGFIENSLQETISKIEGLAPTFQIPSNLKYKEGDFSHQGQAVQAWENSENKGILEMATGSGKTITALVGAQRLYKEKKSLFLVIAAPYKPLIAQWQEEAKIFGLEPIVFGESASRQKKLELVAEAKRRIQLKITDIECLVITHDFLCDSEFQEILGQSRQNSLLVADEVHNLGREKFRQNRPDFFSYRLGLSATPIRQYDDVGNQVLEDFFGPVVFKFGLEEAIGKCLVPYKYFVYPVYFTSEEAQEWQALTERLSALGWLFGDADETQELPPQIKILLIRRRRILEQAEAKLTRLREILKPLSPKEIQHTIFYCTDKAPEQLLEVNRILNELNLRFHQVTAEETQKAQLTQQILEGFTDGYLQALTAKRVLDEGVNIPEIKTAFILASTTVERQWIQRRGRVLRKCKTLEKEIATIFDFIVLPPDEELDAMGMDYRQLIKSELDRVLQFSELATNLEATVTASKVYRKYFTKKES